MAEFDVDLFVIGAGSGGVRAARMAAGHGAKVLIAEEFRIGGTCVIRGCVPKKLMVYASRFKDEFEDAAGFGWSVPQTSFDWGTLVAAKEKEISRLSGVYRANLEKAGVAIIESRAEIEDAHRVRLHRDGRVISARVVLVATGGEPSRLPGVAGLEHTITSNEVFDVTKFPDRLIIIGGGYIAVEFASLFARLGSAVTLVMRASNILRGFDEDLRLHLREALSAAGVRFECGTLPVSIAKRGETLSVTLANDHVLVADQIMIAIGRHPQTNGLGLEKAGVALDAKGAVEVDVFSRTNVEFDLCCRRRHQPAGSDAGRRSRRPGLCRYGLRQETDCGGSHQCRVGGVHDAGDRDGRSNGSQGPRGFCLRRYLHDEFSAAEGECVGPGRKDLHEDHRRW